MYGAPQRPQASGRRPLVPTTVVVVLQMRHGIRTEWELVIVDTSSRGRYGESVKAA